MVKCVRRAHIYIYLYLAILVDTEESGNALREDPACLLFRVVFD